MAARMSESKKMEGETLELNKAQTAQTGKAGAVRLCTYRRRGPGPAFAHAGMAYPGVTACIRAINLQNLNACFLAFTQDLSSIHG